MSPEERASWLKERLTGERAGEEWVEVVSSALRELYERPWRELVPRPVAASFIEAHRTPERGRALGRGIAYSIRAAVEAAREDDLPVDRFVDDPSRDVMVRLARRPGLVPERWVRHAFRQTAAEELVADTLYKSLRDFSTIVPRTLAGILPGMLGRFAKFGSSMVDRVVDELEARLEPEIRRYVEAGTRRALERAADFAVRHLDSEMNRDGRESFLRFGLGSSPRELVLSLSDEVLDDIDALGLELGRVWATSAIVTDAIGAALDEIYANDSEESLRSLVERACGEAFEPPFETWAQAAWPTVQTALRGDAIEAWLQRLAIEMEASPGPG